MTRQELDQLAINTIRTLSIDAVQQAKSGHPGTPMALAPLVYTLWNQVMRFDPKDPLTFNVGPPAGQIAEEIIWLLGASAAVGHSAIRGSVHVERSVHAGEDQS